jgi:hypothetical protein
MRRREFLLSGAAPLALRAQGGEWLRPSGPGDPLTWGRKDGVVFGVPSPGGLRGPRGLIRVGIWNAKTNQPELINFVAIEPVTAGYGSRQSRMGFSELEASELDHTRGKRLTASEAVMETLEARPKPIERLSVRIDVERFTANGAHVYVTASMYANRPEEVVLRVHHHDDSPPIEELTLTATMGNYERLRRLWLRTRVIDSRKLYAGHSGTAFIDKENYRFDEMFLYGDGDALVLATAHEDDPSSVAVTERPSWTYRSIKLTQYWRVPARHIQPDLRVKVNGRAAYWASSTPIPGGVAFENFEVRQRYVPDQEFVFGLTPKTPAEFRPPIPGLPAILPE